MSKPGNDRIVVVARWPIGGIRTYLRDLFASRVLASYEFVLVAPDEEGLEEYLQREKVRVSHWVPAPPSPARFSKEVFRALRKFRPALVHSHGFTSAFVSGAAARLASVHHLLTVHDVVQDAQFRHLKGKLRRLGLSAALMSVDRVHCVGNDSFENLRQYFPRVIGKSGKAFVIPNGVDVERIYAAERRDLKKEIGCSETTMLFGFLGRFMAQKGFHVLVDAMARLRDQGVSPADLRILAVGSGGFLKQDQAAVERRGLSPYFHFWPYQPSVFAILKGLDCLVMPSLWEANSLLAMEAMVAGTPVVGSSCIGLRDTLRLGPGCVAVPPGDADALAHAMLVYTKKPLGEEAMRFRDEAARRFDSQRTFSSLSDAYRATGQLDETTQAG